MAVRLGAEVAVGVASYGGVVFTFHRERLATFRRLLRASRKR